jgi:CubicO group peptidase (beta-lactamase class C family)
MIRYILGGLAALILVAAGWFSQTSIARIYLNAGTGITAKQICSISWVSRMDRDFGRSIYLDPLLGAAGDFINVFVDEDRQQVRTSIFGLWRQRAVFREGLGCTLVHGGGDFDADLALPPAQDFQPMAIDAAHREARFDTEALDAAVEAAFDEGGWPRNTLAVAVLHEGQLVAEHYAPGVSRETPLLGWSMTKSLVATWLGHMVHEGAVDHMGENQVPEIAAYHDDRGDITLDSLIRMAGGMDNYETNSGSDPNSDMLFNASDMPAYAAQRARLHAPLEEWSYQSGNTILTTDTLQRLTGDTLAEQVAGLRARIFEPLGIYSAILEPDETGHFQGSSYLYMTAHDWARLGQLYLDRGLAGETRIIPEDWADYVATPTASSEGWYGAGFWLPGPREGLPEGAYMMQGFQGQRGFILPNEDLVVIRLGATLGNDGSWALAGAVADALLPDSTAPVLDAED